MQTPQRVGLAVLGIALFAVFWIFVVWTTAPEPRRRPTLGISSPHEGKVTILVYTSKQTVAAEQTLPIASAAKPQAVELLRVVLGEQQPTLTAIPPYSDETVPLRSILDAAKTEFGGGFEVQKIAVTNATTPAAEALDRARQFQQKRIVNEAWLPYPHEAIAALLEMVKSGEMLRHIVASLFRVAGGFFLAVLVGIPFGLALGTLAWVSMLTNSLIQFIRPISPIAWLPAATLLFGGGDKAAIFLIFLCSFFPVTISTAAAIATVDLKYRRSAMNFATTGIAQARYVLLPAALPSILTALRVAIGISWLVVVAAEMLGVESGLGYLVLDARNQLRYDKVFAAMIVIGSIGLVIDLFVRKFEAGELERRGLGKR